MKSFEQKIFPYLLLAPTMIIFGLFLFFSGAERPVDIADEMGWRESPGICGSKKLCDAFWR